MADFLKEKEMEIKVLNTSSHMSMRIKRFSRKYIRTDQKAKKCFWDHAIA